MDYQSFKKTIQQSENIIIFSHVNPDGDTLGSMIALYLTIKNNFNKTAKIIYTGKLPDIYSFLPEINNLLELKNIDLEEKYDLAIAIDIAAKDRMMDGIKVFDNAKTRINIDHHKTNNNYADLNFVRGEASCAGEVLLEIIENLNFKIDKNIAEALYTSVLTDTGCFKYENTNAKTLEMASKLISYGANPSYISRCCYESKPKAMVLLQAYAITNAKFAENNKIAYVKISNKDMEKFNAENDHTEGIVEALRQIRTTEISFVLKEVDDNTTKVSLRSKNIDVSEIATVFGGGGHKFAAGCTIRKPLNIACDKMLEEVRKRL